MLQETKKKVHGLLHPEILSNRKWDKIINIFIISLIILNVIAVILETVKSIRHEYFEFFRIFDIVSVTIFSIEYILRVWSCTHDERYKHPVWGRLKYIISPAALIDLLAILPSYYHIFLRGDFDLRILRMLRLLRLFRLFRLTAYTRSARMISNVFRKRKGELTLSLVLVVILIVLSSCILFFIEHGHAPPNEQHSRFTSIPQTIWWSVVTLTTTGYGDMIPITDFGKAMASIIMMTGIAFFALPAGIITAGFIDEFRNEKVRATHKCPKCGEEIELDEEHK